MENVNVTFGARISRRTLLRAGGVSVALPVLDAMTPAFAKTAATASEQDPDGPLFSDFDEIRTEATGFISLKEIGGKRWFIDPNGYAFFPIGVTHSEPFPGIVEQFASVEEYYATAFEGLRRLGFNSLSVLGGPAQEIARKNRVAYTQPINLGIPHGSVYSQPDVFRPDPFTPEYEAMVRDNVKNACDQRRDDPFLLGYSYGFNPFQILHKWINHLLAQQASSPGKVALVATLERLYGSDIEAFNRAYSADFDDFADIKASTAISYEESLNPRPGETSDRPHKRDFDQLVYTVVAKVHEVAHRHLREQDPNHLIFGFYFKTYNANLGLYEAIAPYVDVLSPQHHLVPEYQESGSFDRAAGVIPVAAIYERTGKPIYHSDQWLGKVVAGKAGRRVQGGGGRYPYFHSQESRGEYYEALLERITSFPQIVGFAGCATLFDNPDIDGRHGGNKGLFDAQRTEKIAFTARVEATNARIYERRQQEFSPEDIEALTENAIQALDRATK